MQLAVCITVFVSVVEKVKGVQEKVCVVGLGECWRALGPSQASTLQGRLGRVMAQLITRHQNDIIVDDKSWMTTSTAGGCALCSVRPNKIFPKSSFLFSLLTTGLDLVPSLRVASPMTVRMRQLFGRTTAKGGLSYHCC